MAATVEEMRGMIAGTHGEIPHTVTAKRVDLRQLHDEIEAAHGPVLGDDVDFGLSALGNLRGDGDVIIYPAHPDKATVTQKQLEAAVKKHTAKGA